jgi:hypothetical protein
MVKFYDISIIPQPSVSFPKLARILLFARDWIKQNGFEKRRQGKFIFSQNSEAQA